MKARTTGTRAVARRRTDAAGPVGALPEFSQLVDRLQWELWADLTKFDKPGIIDALPDCVALNPGLADIQIARVRQVGHRDKFPRPYDWENLLPILETGEELLWIVSMSAKDGDSAPYSVYIGLKSSRGQLPDRRSVAERRKRFETICNAFARRTFPESSLVALDAHETVALLERIDSNSHSGVCIIAGMPSPKRLEGDELSEERDEEKRPFASLNDALEPVKEENAFTLVFVVARAESQAIQARFETKSLLRNEIAPMIEQEVQRSVSKSQEEHSDSSSTASTNKTSQQKRSMFKRIGASLLQSFTGTGWYDKDGKWHEKSSRSRRPAPSVQVGSTTSSSSGISKTTQESDSATYTRLNAKLQLLDKSIGRSIKHLQQTCGTGGYWGSIFVYSGDTVQTERIGACLRAVLSGADTYLRPMQALPFLGPSSKFHLHTSLSAHSVLSGMGIDLEVLNVDQAGRLLLLPDGDLPGCQLKRSVFYGRPDVHGHSGVGIGLTSFDQPTLRSPTEQTRVGLSEQCVFRLPEVDLCKHLLVVGTTGSGKTERVVHILNDIDSKRYRVIVIETAKKTYRNRLWRGECDPLVYTLGDSRRRPFRINPFYFDPGASLKRHISVLADAMSELLPMEALIGPKLREAIELSYMECGWNIENGQYEAEGLPRYPDMIVFNAAVHDVCASLDSYGAEVRANYRGALLNRAAIFLDEVYQDIFAFDGNHPIEQLFPCDTIIEMEQLPPSEINMPAFVMSIVIERLRAYRSLASEERQDGLRKPNILLVIEEAHNVLHRKLEEMGSEREAGRGRRLLEQIVRLLQEGRQLGFGVIVVDQSARNLASAVIANTNTKIAHRQEDWDEVETVGAALGIDEEDWKDLQLLGRGECVVRSSVSSRPVKLSAIPKIEPERKKEEWNPFADCAPFADYDKARRAFEWVTRRQAGWAGDEERKAFLDGLLKWADYDYDLVRYAIGRHLIRMQKYDEAKRLVGIRTRKALFERLQLAAAGEAE